VPRNECQWPALFPARVFPGKEENRRYVLG
jgi:hypothetical protein